VKFYKFEDIRAVGNCAEFAQNIYNAKITGGRCAAIWRGGDNAEAVVIDRVQWFDHVQKVGGGIIELAAHKFDGDI